MKLPILTTLVLLTINLQCNNITTTFEPIESYLSPQEQIITKESFEDLFKKANNYFRNEDYNNAILYYKKALKLNPTCAHTYFNLGQAYYWSKNPKKALKSYKKTIRHQPNHARAYAQIGRLFFEARQYGDAIIPLKRALTLDPIDTSSRLFLVRAYNNKQLYTKSFKTLRKGLTLQPNDINLEFELANTYNTVNELDKALALYYELDTKAPHNPSILYNIAFTLKKLGLVAESLPYYNKTLELNPNHFDARFSRGLAYLVLGDFEKGWEGYEWRYHKPDQGSLRTYTQPRWTGENISRKIILIHSEQGLGDTFQFIRYAQLLKEQNAIVIAAVQKPLITLMQLCPYIDKVVAVTDQELPYFDVHAPIMSLPYIMNTRIETIPSEIPYLYADEQLTLLWK